MNLIYEPKSSHMKRAEYDPEARTLSVTFLTDKTYTHINVPRETFENFQKFPSAGKFYHQVIKKFRLKQPEGV